MQKYLYYWLLLIGVSHVILGVLFVSIAKTPLITPYIENLYQVFNVSFVQENDQLLRTILQLFGPTISSWGILFCLAIHQYVKYGARIVKQLIIAALLIWFLFDTGLSITNEIYSHLVINGLAIMSILLLLLLLKPENQHTKVE